MSTVRIEGRDVRVSQELLDRLRKTPKCHVRSVKERIVKWAAEKRPPRKPSGHTPPTRPVAPKGGKGSKASRSAQTCNKGRVPAHVLFRKRHPIARP